MPKFSDLNNHTIEIGARGVPVSKSDDLIRIAALPRRQPLDLNSIEAKAMVEYVMAKYAKPNNTCKCAQIDRQVALGNRTCIKRLLPIQAWALYEIGITKGLVGAIPVGAGKCGTENVEIFDYLTATRRSIAQPGLLDVSSWDAHRQRLRVTGATAFPSGYKPCVKFLLADGSSAEFSTDHPILTQRGWVNACELIVSTDLVAVAAQIPEPVSTTKASDDEVSFVAYMLSDGGCSQDALMFTNGTPSVIEDWAKSSTALGYVVKETASSSQARQFRLNGANKRPFRKKWDLYGLAKNKRVHPSIWGLPRNQVALFLNKFWACDGHVSKRGLECTLASEKLIDDLRFLCTRLGISTRKHYKKASYIKGGIRREFDSWRLSITGASADKFLREVGLVLGKEEACNRLLKTLSETPRNTNHDVVPVSYSETQEICNELGLPSRGSTTKARTEIHKYLGSTKGQYVSRRKFIEFCKLWSYRGKYSHYASEDIAWERVVKVEYIGVHPVYDLNVPGTHNFVANGLVVHNTLLSVMSALALDESLALLLVPPNLIDQLIIDYQLIDQHFKVPSIIVHMAGNKDWRRLIPRTPLLHVLPYSLLQGKNNSDWIDKLAPKAIIADEVDGLADLGSARTKRIARYFAGSEKMTNEQRAERSRTRFCCWTGSLSDKSITEFAHLAAYALKDKSPLPLDQNTVLEWARCVDAVPNPSPVGALQVLCNPGEDAKQAFGRRIRETMGFIVTGTSEVKKAGSIELVGHQIVERKAPPLPDIIEEALAKVRNFQRPDTLAGSRHDEELVEAMEQARYAQQIATGMFYRWIFPRQEPDSLIDEWFAARKEWNKEQRYKLFQSEEFLDSPGLLEDAAKRYWKTDPVPTENKHGVPYPVWKSEAWRRWREVRDKVEPKSKAVRLHDFLVLDAIEWAMEKPGLVWYQMNEFAQWMHELSGLPIHNGGKGADDKLRREDGKRSILVSVKGNHRGRNGLQYLFNRQLITQIFASSRVGEQLFGRIHRQGQKGDVSTELYLHVPEIRKSFDQAIMRAKFNNTIFNQKHKIIDAWDEEDDD